MKTKKYEMRGGEYKDRKIAQVWKRVKKIAVGTAKRLDPRLGTGPKLRNKKYKQHGSVEGLGKVGRAVTRASLITGAVGASVASLGILPATAIGTYGAYRLGRKISRRKAYTRSGKAKKEMRQLLRISHLSTLKKNNNK